MLPIRSPEMTSWIIVFTCGFRPPDEARHPPDRKSTLTPIRKRHHDQWLGGEFVRIDFLVAGLGPLPDADRGAQILAGILGIVGPVEIGELDAAAIDERPGRQIEFQR